MHDIAFVEQLIVTTLFPSLSQIVTSEPLLIRIGKISGMQLNILF